MAKRLRQGRRKDRWGTKSIQTNVKNLVEVNTELPQLIERERKNPGEQRVEEGITQIQIDSSSDNPLPGKYKG